MKLKTRGIKLLSDCGHPGDKPGSPLKLDRKLRASLVFSPVSPRRQAGVSVEA